MKAFILTLSMVFGLSSVGPIGSFSIGESIHAQSSSAKSLNKPKYFTGKKSGQNRKNKDRNKVNNNLYSSSKKNKKLVCKKIKNKKGIRKKVCKLLRK